MSEYLSGLEAVANKLSEILSNVEGFTEASMQEVVSDIRQVAADRAPLGVGVLRGSGETSVETEGTTIIGEVAFRTPYAAAQHEHVEYRHPKGGEAKYLERTALDKHEQIRQMLADGVSKGIGG